MEGEEETEEEQTLENKIPVDETSTFVRRIDEEEIKPFLEAEPIDDLEQDLQTIPEPTRTQTQDSEVRDYSTIASTYAESEASPDYELPYASYTEKRKEQIGLQIGHERHLIETPRKEVPFQREVNMKMEARETSRRIMSEERSPRFTTSREYYPPPQRFDKDTRGLPFQHRRSREII